MLVEFLKPWQGSKVGDVLDIVDSFVQGDLIPRGIAKPVNTTADQELIEQKKKIKEQAAKITQLKKDLKAATQDKMVKGSQTK